MAQFLNKSKAIFLRFTYKAIVFKLLTYLRVTRVNAMILNGLSLYTPLHCRGQSRLFLRSTSFWTSLSL